MTLSGRLYIKKNQNYLFLFVFLITLIGFKNVKACALVKTVHGSQQNNSSKRHFDKSKISNKRISLREYLPGGTRYRGGHSPSDSAKTQNLKNKVK